MSEEKPVDSGEILKTLVKQGAFAAAKEYVVFLEEEAKNKTAPTQGSVPVAET